jgi:hypothetical protein
LANNTRKTSGKAQKPDETQLAFFGHQSCHTEKVQFVSVRISLANQKMRQTYHQKESTPLLGAVQHYSAIETYDNLN